jgi:hypothetical protein
MKPARLIAYLNAIGVGEVASIRTKLDQGAEACSKLAQDELAEMLREAGRALERSDMTTYRKRLKTVVARLGHLR